MEGCKCGGACGCKQGRNALSDFSHIKILVIIVSLILVTELLYYLNLWIAPPQIFKDIKNGFS